MLQLLLDLGLGPPWSAGGGRGPGGTLLEVVLLRAVLPVEALELTLGLGCCLPAWPPVTSVSQGFGTSPGMVSNEFFAGMKKEL